MKLLVATEFPANASGGGPAIVRQMLREWPADDLYWWSCLPDSDLRFEQRVSQHFCAAIPVRLMPHRRLTRLKSALLDRFWTPLASAHLKRTIRRVQPDVIWAIPHNWSIFPLARCLLNSRYAFHVSLHDYAEVHDSPRRFGEERCARMAKFADQLYAAAATRDVISQPMAADLMDRTGEAADAIIRFGLESDQIEKLHETVRIVDGPRPTIRIAHAGTIHKDAVFELLVRSLEQLRVCKRLQLDLYGAHSYQTRSWFNRNWMLEHGNLPEAELNARLTKCDWGFLPMSLDDSDPRYDRFSFPTKFVAYLAAGIPIITLAHKEASAAKMAAAYKVGLLSHSTDASSLSEVLSSVFNDPNPKESYRSEIIRCARVEFNAPHMRRTLFECFKKCANQAVGRCAVPPKTL